MVMKIEPIFNTLEIVKSQHAVDRIILLSASGARFDQRKAEELSAYKDVVLICGHYEGVDDRVATFVDEELSIGDFILTGGEPAALVIVDSVCRLLPGVLGNICSTQEESHTGEPLLEHPQFTRPPEFRGLSVPDVLFSGNHAKISKWRRKQSIARTISRRPDLWAKHTPDMTDFLLLAEIANEAADIDSTASVTANTAPTMETEAGIRSQPIANQSNLTTEVEKS